MSAREFAFDVVKKLRTAGFDALWAGGCVRDQLIKRPPKDYDVATNATPTDVRKLFGHRRTLALGEAFGVIVVLGTKESGPVEVATFRKDAEYTDGRHPDRVDFCDASEDARRRDFTINGLFFDPIEERVIDYVGGVNDLEARIVRAIGSADQRFSEDKLRVLRAVRFATELDFEIEPLTLAAVTNFVNQLSAVSAERITQEMRRLLVSEQRSRGVGLLVQTGLLEAILPECEWTASATTADPEYLRAQAILNSLADPTFPLALAAVLRHRTLRLGDGTSLKQFVSPICRRWKMANSEERLVIAALQHEKDIVCADELPMSRIQPILIRKDATNLVRFAEAVAMTERPTRPAGIGRCRQLSQQHPSKLNPPPLVTGNDLSAAGIPPGAIFKTLLQRVRDAQLDGVIGSATEAMQLVNQVLKE